MLRNLFATFLRQPTAPVVEPIRPTLQEIDVHVLQQAATHGGTFYERNKACRAAGYRVSHGPDGYRAHHESGWSGPRWNSPTCAWLDASAHLMRSEGKSAPLAPAPLELARDLSAPIVPRGWDCA